MWLALLPACSHKLHPSKILHSELSNNGLRAKKEDMLKYWFESNNALQRMFVYEKIL
jgi:hypothetical protein